MTKAIQAGRARIDAPCETTDSPAFPASYEAPPELRVRGIPDGKGRSIVAGASALALAACGQPANYLDIDSRYGHDAFLVETEQVSRILRAFLNKEVAR